MQRLDELSPCPRLAHFKPVQVAWASDAAHLFKPLNSRKPIDIFVCLFLPRRLAFLENMLKM